MSGQVLGICNPLLDISADIEPSLLEKYGLKSGDIILAESKHLPLYQELVDNYKVKYIAGGAGQNTIRAAQWLLQTPKSTIYLGCIGQDIYGKILKEEASKDGVDVHYLEDEKTPTGTCAVLILKRERTLVANLSAANCYKKSHYDSSEIQQLVNNAKIFYITGFFLTVSPETMIAVGKHAAETNKIFVMNLSAPFLIDFFYDKMEQVLPYVDIVVGNEHEFGALGKKHNWGDNVGEVAQKLAATPKINASRTRLCLVTQGKHSTLVCSPDSMEAIPVPPVPKEEIIDTNGAGDSFVGGLLASLSQGKTIKQSVDAGHYVAGVTIRTSGTDFRGKTPNFV